MTCSSATVHHWFVAGFALCGRLGKKKFPVRPWIKCLHRLKAIVLPAKSLAALNWISELPHSFAGIGVRMLNKSREDKDCGICYRDSTIFIPFTLIWHFIEWCFPCHKISSYHITDLPINLFLSLAIGFFTNTLSNVLIAVMMASIVGDEREPSAIHQSVKWVVVRGQGKK